MTLVRMDPFRNLVSVKRDLDRFFGDWDEESETSVSHWRPVVDIFETKDNLVLLAELPGMDKKDISINIENNTLTLSGERTFDQEVKKENYHRIERAYGSFSRSFSLPATISKDKVEARYENGVLEVYLPKSEESKPREIEVRVK